MSIVNEKYYKYRPLYTPDGKEHPFTASIIEKAELWFSAPKDFNDPFDCNLRLHVNDSTDEEWEGYMDDMMRAYPADRRNLEIAKKQKIWRKGPDALKIGEKTWKENYERSSVFCLSKKANSIPMFSYYADCHRGIAIEFEFSSHSVPCGVDYISALMADSKASTGIVFRDVEYPPAFPELNYHRLYNTPQLLVSMIFTKHHEWQHEEEYRIFRKGIPASSVVFEKKLIPKIVFGCRTEQRDVDLVTKWLAGWPTDVILSKATQRNDSFDLDVVDFDLIKGIGSP
jgi:hypothetical protein